MYKRQVSEEPVLIRDLECDRTQAIEGTVVREVSVKRVRNLQVVTGYLRDERGDAIKATWFNSPYSVSYTHLDVYKRQPPTAAPATAAAPIIFLKNPIAISSILVNC